MNCYGCLGEGLKLMEGYCFTCLDRLFEGRTISSTLDFERNVYGNFKAHQAVRLSISGIQSKVSLKVVNNALGMTEKEGEFILKPSITYDGIKYGKDSPANEHLSMQMAGQLFGIIVAENALVKFSNGDLAYMTKRFDRDGKRRLLMEDFAQILGVTGDSDSYYKYNEKSYENIWGIPNITAIERLRYFQQIVFNFMFDNNDAHLKNFAMVEIDGIMTLSPAFDLLNTRLHLDHDKLPAMNFFRKRERSRIPHNSYRYGKKDLIELAKQLDIPLKMAEKFIQSFDKQQTKVLQMIQQSYLSEKAKKRFAYLYQQKLSLITKHPS